MKKKIIIRSAESDRPGIKPIIHIRARFKLTTFGKNGGKMQSDNDDVIVIDASVPRKISWRQLNLCRLFCAASS